MRIGILGPPPMVLTWEQHLQTFSSIDEVFISRDPVQIPFVDAVLILGEYENTPSRDRQIIKMIKSGCHLLWVASVPLEPAIIHNWNKACDESGSILMFSMWSHYAPAVRWLMNHIEIPRSIHIHREWSGPKHTPDWQTMRRIVLEELSLCLEWIPGEAQRIESGYATFDCKNRETKPHPSSLQHFFIRFSNQSTASILLNPCGLENRHSRFVTGDKMAAVCEINEQMIKKWLFNDMVSHTPEIMRFEYIAPARHLLSHFFRCIRNGNPPLFGIRQLEQLSRQIQKFNL